MDIMMGASLKNISRKFKNKGFVGPRYSGLRGKLRLLLQDRLTHIERIMVATPDTFQPELSKLNSEVSLELVNCYEDAAQYRTAFEKAYYRDVTRHWSAYFEWGDILSLAIFHGKVVGFGWIQSGERITKSYYGPLDTTEYRVYRAGVFPDVRRQRVQASRHKLVLEHLFSEGATRVFVDVFEDNIPNIKALHYAGFRDHGRIRVVTLPFTSNQYIHWI